MGWMVPMMAAAAQRQEDDKLLAELIAKDTDDKYEFKILRGGMRAFHKPERLQIILEEERRSQWEMVLKLDDERLVLRRPRRAQAYDAAGGANTDPYRTQIGNSRMATKISILLGISVLMGGLVAFMSLYNTEVAAETIMTPTTVIAVAIGILLIMVVGLKLNR